MKRINHNTSGVIDLFLGEETIDLIEGVFFSRQEEPLNFEDKFRDTFFAAKPDVRDETVARFAANRFSPHLPFAATPMRGPSGHVRRVAAAGIVARVPRQQGGQFLPQAHRAMGPRSFEYAAAAGGARRLSRR
jgi:hypothetical protein